MATRTINSPGVQISETDLSLKPVTVNTTTILIPGFAPKGPTNDPILVSSLSEFEQIYGTPSNGAERYFYNSVKAALNSPADVLVTRLPYGVSGGNTVSDQYGVLAYPAIYTTSAGVTSTDFTQSTGTYILGAPKHYAFTKDQYLQFLQGSLFSFSSAGGSLTSAVSSLGNAALIIVNQSQSTVNSIYEGYYVGICDNANLNPATNFDTFNAVKSINSNSSFVNFNSYQNIPSARIGFPLSAAYNGADGSLSEIQESQITSFDIYNREFDDTIVIGLYKLRQSINTQSSITLDFVAEEGYIGSFDAHRTINTTDGGPAKNFFIESVAGDSNNIIVKVNPFLSHYRQGGSYLDGNGEPTIKIRCANPNLTSTITSMSATAGFSSTSVLTAAGAANGYTNAIYPAGVFQPVNVNDVNVGNIPYKLQVIFDRIINAEVYQIDILPEAGLGTVYACAQENSGIFDDYKFVDVSALTAYDGNPVSSTLIDNYLAVLNVMKDFVQNDARKDFVVIPDPLIPIFVQGNTVKTLNDDAKNFTQNILWPLKNLYASINSSYLCTFGTCVKVNDLTTGLKVWVPFSGFMAAIMANTDSQFQRWSAPAGFTRGIVNDVLDIAFYPRQKQRDQLYKININAVAFFPSDGFVVYGQKTMQRKPSAFDRINVRRLFLALEIATKNTLKYFVMEPNTLFTRTQVINTLTPIFENAKNTDGIYDYLLICDERNNTPTVIDDNTMVTDIYVKPVRTGEYILANFYATRTGVNFQEIVG